MCRRDRCGSPARRRLQGRGVRLALIVPALLLLAGCTAPVRVEWTTEVETNTAGFDLYRGESRDGPFDVKVNDALIPASPDPMAGGQYHFIDRTTAAGKTYYYQLQEVELSGSVNTYGPIEVRAGWLDARWIVALAAAVAVILLLLVVVLRRRKP